MTIHGEIVNTTLSHAESLQNRQHTRLTACYTPRLCCRLSAAIRVILGMREKTRDLCFSSETVYSHAVERRKSRVLVCECTGTYPPS